MSKLDEIIGLHRQTATKVNDMLVSIRAIHGKDAERSMRLQYDLMTHLMNITTTLAAAGMPKPMVLAMTERSRDLHGQVAALAMSLAVAHIDDDTKAGAVVDELMGFLKQMADNFTSSLEKAIRLGEGV